MKYAGLTDDPFKCMQKHGNPIDWQIQKYFNNEEQAYKWKSGMQVIGYQDKSEENGWHFGFTFSATKIDSPNFSL